MYRFYLPLLMFGQNPPEPLTTESEQDLGDGGSKFVKLVTQIFHQRIHTYIDPAPSIH